MSIILNRRLYAPGHFGSSYEVMWPREMKAYLAEQQWWGFTGYMDWFDPSDLKNPRNNPRGIYLMPQSYWDRKLAHYRGAAELGFATDLIITPNHVFTDQVRPEIAADESNPRYFGQLVCPSKPEGREIILGNCRELFEDLKNAGVELDAFTSFPLDYGGCACESCEPWVLTWGALSKEMVAVAREFFPNTVARMGAWWLGEDDLVMLRDWVAANAPGLFSSIDLEIPYGKTAPDMSMTVPDGCERHAFLHPGYGDKGEPRDVYGLWGPVMAPNRIPKTIDDLAAQGVTGYTTYSEGVFGDANRAILAGISSGKFATAHEALEAYAERYFGANGLTMSDWADWLADWGEPYDRDLKKARREYALLSKGAMKNWRLEAFECKLRIMEAHRQILDMTEWNEARLVAAESFFAEREYLQRQVWKLGLMRHILYEGWHAPSWYEEWVKAAGERNQKRGDLDFEA